MTHIGICTDLNCDWHESSERRLKEKKSCPKCKFNDILYFFQKPLKSGKEELLREMDNFRELYIYCRERFPYMNDDEENKQILSVESNHSRGIVISLCFPRPLSKEDIKKNNDAAHLINRNFFLDLYAILDFYKVFNNFDKLIAAFESMVLLRAYRHIFAHTTGRLSSQMERNEKFYKRFNDHFGHKITIPKDYVIPIDDCLKLHIECRGYVEAIYKKNEIKYPNPYKSP